MDMLEVVYLPVGELKPYERNARKHTERDLATIVESIKEFGFNDPIGIWGKTISLLRDMGGCLPLNNSA